MPPASALRVGSRVDPDYIIQRIAPELAEGREVVCSARPGAVAALIVAAQRQGWELEGTVDVLKRERLLRLAHDPGSRRDAIGGDVVVRVPNPPLPDDIGERIRELGDRRAIAYAPGADPDPDNWTAFES